MKAWTTVRAGDTLELSLEDRPEPEPGESEIRVKMVAAGLNYRDTMILRLQYNPEKSTNRVPLSDGLGVVDAIGPGVSGFAIGDRVIAPHFLDWIDGPFSPAIFGRDLGVTADGWLREQLTLPAASAIKVPDGVNDATAATLAVAGGTVWHAMVAFGGVRPSDLVLAQGTGGVATLALQLAKALGADFAITSSSNERLARARELGADFTVNYRERPDWDAALLDATGGRGVDVVVDTLGFGALTHTTSACAVGGRIGIIGMLAQADAESPFPAQVRMIGKNLTIKGLASGSRAMLADALKVIADNGIETPIDGEYAFADAAQAYAQVERGGQFGKVLVRGS